MEILINSQTQDKLVFENYEWKLIKDDTVIYLDNSAYMTVHDIIMNIKQTGYELTSNELNLLHHCITSFVLRYINQYDCSLSIFYISVLDTMVDYFSYIAKTILKDCYDMDYLDFSCLGFPVPNIQETTHIPPRTQCFYIRNSIVRTMLKSGLTSMTERICIHSEKLGVFYFNVINLNEEEVTYIQQFYKVDYSDFLLQHNNILHTSNNSEIILTTVRNLADSFNNVNKDVFNYTQQYIKYDKLIENCRGK